MVTLRDDSAVRTIRMYDLSDKLKFQSTPILIDSLKQSISLQPKLFPHQIITFSVFFFAFCFVFRLETKLETRR